MPKNKILIPAMFLIFVLSSCTKQTPVPSTSTITYSNPTFTPIYITVNGNSQTISAGSSIVFSGTPNTSASVAAFTSGQTTNGTQVGLKLTWNLNNTFPSSGNLDQTLNVGGNYFFLKIKNLNPSFSINGVYVNYGLTDQSLDNINIPNDGNTYNIGYYDAWSNSSVYAIANNGTTWLWQSLNLQNINNQSIALQAN